jgi:hypothetical protein
MLIINIHVKFCMFIPYPHTKFHMSSLNGSLVISTEPQTTQDATLVNNFNDLLCWVQSPLIETRGL